MPHDTPLIATIVAGLGLAFIFGALANRFRMPPLVGYLVAGVLVGPNTPGFVADQALAQRTGRDRRHPADVRRRPAFLAEGPAVGARHRRARRHRPDRLRHGARRRPRLDARLVDRAPAWSSAWRLSVAITVVLLRALQERRLIETERGRIAVGWLIVEDLAMVLALVLLPALAGVLGGQRAGRRPRRACCRCRPSSASGASSA